MSRPSSSQSSTAVLAVANGAPSHESASRTIDLREIVRILRRRSRIIVVTSIIVVALSLVFVSVVGPVYTATSTVLIDPRRTNVIDTNNQAVSSSFGSDDAVTESQALLIQSVSLLQLVVERLKLADDPEFAPPPGIVDTIKALFASSESAPGASPEEIGKAKAVERLQKRLKVVRQRTTFLIDINASSHEPAKAAAIANAVAEAYFLEQVRSKYDATKAAADWLNQQIEALKARVLATDKAVEDFRAGNNLIASQGVTVNDQQITDLNNKLIEARVQTAEAYAKYDQVQRIADSGRDPGSVAEALSSDTIVRLRAQYADLAKNGADLASKYGARHPAMATVRAQLRDTQRLINEEVQRILQSRRHTYEVAAAREASLQRSLDELQGVSTDSGQAQIRLRELQREAEANRTLYEFVPRPLQGSQRAGKPGNARGADRHQGRSSDPPVISEDFALARSCPPAGPRSGERVCAGRRLLRSPHQDARTGHSDFGASGVGCDPIGRLARACPIGQARTRGTRKVRSENGAAAAAGAATGAHALCNRGTHLDVCRGSSGDPPCAAARHQVQDWPDSDGHVRPGRRGQDHLGRKSRPLARRDRRQDGAGRM